MKLNDACVHDHFLISLTNEVLDNIGRKEAYSFIYGFFGLPSDQDHARG